MSEELFFSLPLSELVLVLSQFQKKKKKNHKLAVGLLLPHSFLKLLKSKKMCLKIMQGSGLWKMVCLQAGLFFLLLSFQGLFDLSCWCCVWT